MKKRILLLSSSPRRHGNSDRLCDEFLRGAREAGHDAEKISLRDCRIGYCTGCGVCYDTRTCPQRDDAAQIVGKMIAADVIVLATPVYFYTMSAQMKTLIDRCCARYTEMTGKEFYRGGGRRQQGCHGTDDRRFPRFSGLSRRFPRMRYDLRRRGVENR